MAGIQNASTHTLRKTAGAWYYMATRDIFATSKFLGHSSVSVTEKHYAGLIQSLKVEYSDQFEEGLNSRLLIGCYFETKQNKSRPIENIKEVKIMTPKKGKSSSINAPFREGLLTVTPERLERSTNGLKGHCAQRRISKSVL